MACSGSNAPIFFSRVKARSFANRSRICHQHTCEIVTLTNSNPFPAIPRRPPNLFPAPTKSPAISDLIDLYIQILLFLPSASSHLPLACSPLLASPSPPSASPSSSLPTFTVETAIDSVGFGPFQYFLLGYAGLAWMAESMELMLLSFVGPAVQQQWGLSSEQESYISSAVFLGMLVGAYSWGLLADARGRRYGTEAMSTLVNWVVIPQFPKFPAFEPISG